MKIHYTNLLLTYLHESSAQLSHCQTVAFTFFNKRPKVTQLQLHLQHSCQQCLLVFLLQCCCCTYYYYYYHYQKEYFKHAIQLQKLRENLTAMNVDDILKQGVKSCNGSNVTSSKLQRFLSNFSWMTVLMLKLTQVF